MMIGDDLSLIKEIAVFFHRKIVNCTSQEQSWLVLYDGTYNKQQEGLIDTDMDSRNNRKHVVVQPYDETWKADFAAIRDELNAVLSDLALRIEHVGSTSVEGLSAKPVIDIDVVIQDRTYLPAVISALRTIGYTHEGDLGIPGREAFKYSGKEHLRKHHLYVCSQDSEELKRHVAFRDHLRSNPDAAAEYSRIKEEGAQLYPWDIDKYIEHKSPFVEMIYKRIGLEH